MQQGRRRPIQECPQRASYHDKDAHHGPVVIDPAHVERSLVQQFADRGLKVTRASCPETISTALGDLSTCDIDFSDGEFGNATIKVLDAKGTFELISFRRSLAKPPGG